MRRHLVQLDRCGCAVTSSSAQRGTLLSGRWCARDGARSALIDYAPLQSSRRHAIRASFSGERNSTTRTLQHHQQQQQQRRQPVTGGDDTDSSWAPQLGLAVVLLSLASAVAPALAQEAHSSAEVLHRAPSWTHLADLGENEDFWANMTRYGRFFVTVMLGTATVMVRPLQAMLKRPVTAVVAVVALVGATVFLKVTLEAMLGLSQPLD